MLAISEQPHELQPYDFWFKKVNNFIDIDHALLAMKKSTE
jgi:hypothetical protein